jgi:magnesium transporter
VLTPKLQMLQRTLKRLIRRDADQPLENVLNKAHVADLGYLLPTFSEHEQKTIFDRLGQSERQAEVLSAADSDVSARIIQLLAKDAAAELLQLIEPDDASDILQHLPEDLSEELLQLMSGEDRTEVEHLNRYDEETAGGIMSPRFFALQRDMTAVAAIEELQRVHDELEMVFYVYVINELSQLLGVVSLRQLVTAKKDTTLFDLMTAEVVSVTPEEDQEEVAKIASRYGLLAVPVVDHNNRLLGIVTVDDVIDVLREEATEDVLRMAGAGNELIEQHGVVKATLQRVRWLFVVAVGGVLGAALLATYASRIHAFIPIVFLVPLVLGLSGFIGLQGGAVITQLLLQGRLGHKIAPQLLRQTAIGLLLGLLFGVIAGLFYWVWITQGGGGTPLLAPAMAGVALAAGVAVALCAAATLGGMLPLAFARIGVDPALAAGPLGAVTIDLLALWAFLLLTSFWL